MQKSIDRLPVLPARIEAFAASPAGAVAFWALGTAVLYFTAARFGLNLLAKPSNVAVFWPASGIGAGLMVAAGLAGSRTRMAIAAGIFASTAFANLLGDRNVTLAIAFGICNAGEAYIFARLLSRSPGAERFADLNGAVWFLFAAAVSAGLMAVMASLAIGFARPGSGGFFDTSWEWWASDAVGIIAFAPFVMATAGEWRQPWQGTQDTIHGPVALSALIAIAGLTYLLPARALPWWSTIPVATLFPFLLWLGARCRAIYATAGIMLVGLIVVIATIEGQGPFGDAALPLPERVFNARITLVSIAFCGLAMVAAFNQQRANQERVDKLAASAPGMIYSFHIARNGFATMPYASAAIANLLGTTADAVAKDGLGPFRKVHPEDRSAFNLSVQYSQATLEPWKSEFRYHHPRRGEIWLEGHAAPVREPDGSVTWHGFLQDISQRKEAERNVELLMGEVNHRANNLLSVVQGVVFHTSRQADPTQFAEILDKRMHALAVSHSLLVAGQWHGVPLDRLVERQLSYLGDIVGTRISVSGPVAMLTSAATQVIGMALHELATNAIKYGALSTSAGHVLIRWSLEDTFRMSWEECDGPPVTPPTRRGFGHRVLVRIAEHQLDANVQLVYAATGLRWMLTAPLDRVIETAATEPVEP